MFFVISFWAKADDIARRVKVNRRKSPFVLVCNLYCIAGFALLEQAKILHCNVEMSKPAAKDAKQQPEAANKSKMRFPAVDFHSPGIKNVRHG